MTRGLMATAAVAGAAGLTACGSGGGGGGTQAVARTAASTAATTTAAAATTTTAAAAGGVAAPGTTLKVGATAHVAFTPLSGGGSTEPLDVSVKRIAKGPRSDLAGVTLDADEKGSVPYYVTVKVTNPNATPIDKQNDPDVRFRLVDDRGQEHDSTIFLGSFKPCDDKNPPADFKDGKSYTSCLVVLEPAGGSIASVRWEGANEYYSKPVTWH